MTDPMEHVGEEVPQPIKPEFALLLALIQETLHTPKPVGRDQAALEILTAMIPCVWHESSVDILSKEVERTGGGLINLAIEMADSLFLRLDTPAAEKA
jgi:hypothetical protein